MDLQAIKGEKGTGFEKAGKLGEFECGNCEYWSNGLCGQKDMMHYSKQPRAADGRVRTGEEDCCEYVDRIGRKDRDKDSKRKLSSMAGKYGKA